MRLEEVSLLSKLEHVLTPGIAKPLVLTHCQYAEHVPSLNTDTELINNPISLCLSGYVKGLGHGTNSLHKRHLKKQVSGLVYKGDRKGSARKCV